MLKQRASQVPRIKFLLFAGFQRKIKINASGLNKQSAMSPHFNFFFFLWNLVKKKKWMVIGPNVNVKVIYKFLVKQFNALNLKKLKCFHIP